MRWFCNLQAVPWLILLLWFGCLSARASDIGLVRIGESWRYQKGLSDRPFPEWTQPGYNDAAWFSGLSGFSGWNLPEATVISDYGLGYTTVYFRKNFDVTEPGRVHWLILRADFDDALVVYLNGQEVLRRGVPGEPGEAVPANTLGTLRVRGGTEEFNLSHAIPHLTAGMNTLAVQLLGATNSPGMGLNLELLANFNRGPFLQSTSTNSTLVVWKTPVPADGFIEFGLDTAEVERLDVSSAATNHVAALTDLLPGTRYYYRVGARDDGSEVLSDWAELRTLKMEGPISFTILGDSGVGNNNQYTIARRMQEAGGDLIMHLGDMIYYAFHHYNADFRCLSVYADQLRTTPMFIALGNHDFYGDRTALLDTFYLPTNNVTGTEHYYSFDHGDVHFTVVWTDLQMAVDYSVGSVQHQWLTNDLATTTKPWKLLFFHHTIRSSSVHQYDDYDLNGIPDEIQLQESIGRAASDYGVQIMFNGHDHCYEKCAPVAGPLGFTSGGGGAGPYGLYRLRPTSVQFHSRHHFLHVEGGREELRIRALGLDGGTFDLTHVRRELPGRESYTAAWHSPLIEPQAGNDGDGNIAGQTFDFTGARIGGSFGRFSSPGQLYVNHDGTNLYFGLNEVLLQQGQEVYLFVEVPGVEGVSSMQSIGNGLVDPHGEGVDGLDFLENLAFTNFTPSVAAILGDEYGDAPSRSSRRHGMELHTGNGAYFLRGGLPIVPGQQVQQFHRSPQDLPQHGEENASLIELAIPINQLEGFDPHGSIKVAAVVALTNINAQAQTRELDTGAIAWRFERLEGLEFLEGVELALASAEDHDGDGLSESFEISVGTDPQDPDTDKDGMTDGWEVRHRLNPLLGSGADGPSGDPDFDGFTNLEEFQAGTNPRDVQSVLKLSAGDVEGGIAISWPAVPGRRYQLEFKESLQGVFQPIPDGDFPRQATASLETFLYELAEGHSGPLYFRVQILP